MNFSEINKSWFYDKKSNILKIRQTFRILAYFSILPLIICLIMFFSYIYNISGLKNNVISVNSKEITKEAVNIEKKDTIIKYLFTISFLLGLFVLGTGFGIYLTVDINAKKMIRTVKFFYYPFKTVIPFNTQGYFYLDCVTNYSKGNYQFNFYLIFIELCSDHYTIYTTTYFSPSQNAQTLIDIKNGKIPSDQEQTNGKALSIVKLGNLLSEKTGIELRSKLDSMIKEAKYEL